jgi:predicted neuraminidase
LPVEGVLIMSVAIMTTERSLDCFLPTRCVQNHAAFLHLMPNGELGCVWFGGTQEGVPDISVQFSRLGPNGWSEPAQLSDDSTRSEQNPLLFTAPDGRLWLLWTAQISGHQDTAIIRRRVSPDGGRTWGPVGTLLDRTGLFIRQPIVVLSNGDWLLPAWICPTPAAGAWRGDEDTSVVLASSDQGTSWVLHDVPASVGCVHMNILDLEDGTLLALYRSRWADCVYASRSRDGREWSVPVPTELPNNNSSIQATRLANGHIALAYNHASAADATGRRLSLYDDIGGELPAGAPAGGRAAFWGAPRAPMTVAISEDGGRTWPHRRDVETGDGFCMTNNSKEKLNRELSYPSIVQTPDGALHLAYTHFRQAIRYVPLSEAWVNAG